MKAVTVTVECSSEEREAFKSCAASSGLSLSKWGLGAFRERLSGRAVPAVLHVEGVADPVERPVEKAKGHGKTPGHPVGCPCQRCR